MISKKQYLTYTWKAWFRSSLSDPNARLGQAGSLCATE
ncbi:hypothetical protein H845_1301 [Komagataeibacter xylinus E25]|nr:hypothetical protein H845_1301 [Komagataeibacter xylinus E25]